MTNLNLESHIKTKYKVECYENYYRLFGLKLFKRNKPKLKWVDEWTNIVVTAGLNKVLDATFVTGLTTPLWYIGLKGIGTPVAADTMASHASWAEITPYSNANRPTWTPGAISAGSVDNSITKAVFNINVTSTIVGAFMADNNIPGGTTGTLYGVGDFTASRAVLSGDTINIIATISQS